MNTKHPLGPWHIIPTGAPFAGDIADERGEVVAQAFGVNYKQAALLIAKAPDMLEELRNAAHDLDGPHDPQAIRARLLAMIAQATGE